MKEQPPNQASGASETARLFCTQISPAASAAGELKQHRKEPDMAKRENEGKKEKKQKKERKEKRKQYRGLYLNPISVPRARTRACEGRRLACTCTFREAGEAAMHSFQGPTPIISSEECKRIFTKFKASGSNVDAAPLKNSRLF